MRSLWTVAIPFALLSFGRAIAAPAATGGDVFDLAHPAVRVFSDREGLPQNTVHSIERDTLGYLWVGTQDGAARFNGRAWTVFDMPDREVSNYVRAVIAAPDGSIWFGRDNGGVVRLKEGRFTVFGSDRGLPAGRVNFLTRAHDGTIWAATLGGGAARFDGTRFVAVQEGLPDPRLWVVQEIEDDSGQLQLVAGGEGGLAVLEGARWRPVDLGPGGTGSANWIAQGPGPGPRTVWISTYGRGVLAATGWRGERVEHVARFGPAEGLLSRLVTSVAVTRTPSGGSHVWATTRDAGLFRLEGARFLAVPLAASITEAYCLRAGGEDDPGALWVGTRTSGLLRLEAASWVAIDRSSGLPTDQVLGLLETRGPSDEPIYWVGTANGLTVIRGGRLSVEGTAQGLPGPQVLALAEVTERGRSEIWASVVGLGLVRRVGERWERVDARPAFDADYGAWLLATNDPDGAAVLWVGTERNGLARMTRGRWTVLTTKDGLPSDHVVALLETEAGGRRSLWVGMRGGGIAEIVDGRVAAAWNRASGLPNDEAMSLAEVALPGGRREVWAGTRAGVARRSVEGGGGWTRLTSVSGPPLPSETVLSIGQDRTGRIYLGTQRGVARLSPQAPGARPAEFEAEVFGPSDGLPSATVNWGQLRDSRGRIWIATTGGVALFDPARETTFKAPPAPLVLESALVSTTARPIAPGALLSPQERDVTFEFALLTPRRAGAVRYRTQLVGYDPAPSPWTDEYRKSYTNLPAASYLFRVEAREGAESASGPVERAFTVRAPVWLRPWALALEVLAAVSAIALLLRFREGALRRRTEGLAVLVAERTRQLSEANVRLAELSVTDPLTSLPNRRRLEAHAEEEWRRATRRGEGLAFLMLDVDHFKYYNDALGHLAGDACLTRVGAVLSSLLKRPSDLVARYGGEEFACLLSGLAREQAVAQAERLRAAVEGLDLPHPASSVGPRVTISIGVAWTEPAPTVDWRATLAAADEALYRAKAGGRNRVELAS